MELELNKAPGFCLITAKVLRELLRKAIVYQTKLFNRILRTLHFPSIGIIQISEIHMVPKPRKPSHLIETMQPQHMNSCNVNIKCLTFITLLATLTLYLNNTNLVTSLRQKMHQILISYNILLHEKKCNQMPIINRTYSHTVLCLLRTDII